MALSSKAKRRIEVALARRAEALEVIAAIESGANQQAAAVAAFSATANVGTTDGSGGDAALAADVESRLDAIESKINAILTALKNAALMAP